VLGKVTWKFNIFQYFLVKYVDYNKKVHDLHAARLVIHATRPQRVSDGSAPTQNRQIFSEPLSENDFRAPIYITSIPRSMHSKDPLGKVSSCKLEEIDASESGEG